MKKIFIYITIILINSCSSLTKEDCVSQNWFELGKSDAMSGETEPKTADYRKDCSKHGLQIKSMDYLKGFEVGLKKHCTYQNGFDRGEAGYHTHSLCEEVNPKYKEGYTVGYREYQRKESIEELKKKIAEDHGGKTCNTSLDCMMEGDCRSSQCKRSGKKCDFDSDCEYEGNCEAVSAWTDFNDFVQVNVCKEKND